MKRLGILDDEGLSHDDLLLRYFSLFKGPLTEDTMKAMTALCGLDAEATLPATHAYIPADAHGYTNVVMLVIVCRYGSPWSSTSFVTVQSWCLGSTTARGLQSPTLHSVGTRQLVVSCRKNPVSNKRLLCNTTLIASGF